ncbi:AAA family ATPase [Cellulomonas sp. A375-1]|uniref:HelD family protein n=1 Tax=Cellulomonas sp. A375-1 TaxID=1672219 RepID=UPI000AF63774|nr:AAA family ATPase [Cellulomonas sp. A375-1]
MVTAVPQIDADLASEQEWFDAARAERETKRESRAGAYDAAATPKDRSAINRAQQRDETLGHPDDDVAFLRIDCEDGDVYYVGKNSIVSQAGDQMVYNWKARAIQEMRGATHSDPRGVHRHREYSTRPVNAIARLNDVLFAELAAKVAALEGGEAALLTSDGFLQDVLERRRSPQMEDIVRTIQAAQADIISAAAEQLLIVQGGPGTGKTAVALHRVAALLFNELKDVERDDVLVVGPNATFLRYIARVLPELGEDRVIHQDVQRLMDANVTVSVKEQPEAARLKGDDRMCEVLSRGLQERVRVPQDDVQFSFDDVSWRVTLQPTLVGEAMVDIETSPYAPGRARMRTALEALILREARRTDRAGARASNLRPKSTEVDAYLERIWPQLTPQAFLRDLFGSLERLVAASSGTLDVEALQLLRRQAAPRLSEQQWSKEDLPLLDFLADEITGERRTYAHIVVDEAQDLSPMQLIAIRRRSRAGAMTIVGDIAQSTGHWARGSWDDVISELESPLPHSLEHLRYGYRVPRAVMELAARLLPEAAPGIDAPTVVTDVDRAPAWHPVATRGDLVTTTLAAVQKHSSKGLFVGVVRPESHRDELAHALDAAEISWSDADDGELTKAINVVSPTAAKGLEFDAVVVLDPQAIVDAGPHGLRMLYVALTRTTGHLDIVHVDGQVPACLIGDPISGDVDHQHERVPAATEHAVDMTGEDPSGASEHRQTDVEFAPHAEPATGRQIHDSAQQRDRPSRTAASTSIRRSVVETNAHHVLDMLAEVAPEHMWADILDRARELTEEPHE